MDKSRSTYLLDNTAVEILFKHYDIYF